MPPSVPFYVSSHVSLSHRSDQGMSLSLESHDSARLGIQSSQSLSLGSDQSRVFEGGSLGASSALSPTSLLFPVPDSESFSPLCPSYFFLFFRSFFSPRSLLPLPLLRSGGIVTNEGKPRCI